MADLKMLEEFTQADGVSGFEKEATRVMKKYLEGNVDEIFYDNLGSIVGHKKGNGPKILFTGHIDEVGFIVKEISKDGFIRIHPLGGWNTGVMLSQPYTITTKSGNKYVGYSGTRKKKTVKVTDLMPMEDVYLDLGVANKKEVTDLGISIGDPVTPKSEFSVMNNPDYVSAKAWDDRVATAICCDIMKNLKDESVNCDFYVAGTVQEEVGLRGAKTVGQMIAPDISIAIDVGGENDSPNLEKGIAVLGSGVAICIRDNAFIAHPGLVEHLEKIAEANDIKYTNYVFGLGGTDSGELHKVGKGSINLTISIPCRDVHSHHSMIHLKDYDAIVRLLTLFIKTFDNQIYQTLLNYKR